MIQLIESKPGHNIFEFKGEQYTVYAGSDLIWKAGVPATQQEALEFNLAWEA